MLYLILKRCIAFRKCHCLNLFCFKSIGDQSTILWENPLEDQTTTRKETPVAESTPKTKQQAAPKRKHKKRLRRKILGAPGRSVLKERKEEKK